MGISHSMTWERCIERYESWGKQLEEAEIKYAHDPVKLHAMRELLNPKHLARDQAMIDLIHALMNYPEISDSFRHVSHQTLRFWYPENEGFELRVGPIDLTTYWIGLNDISAHDEFVGHVDAVARIVKYYLLWLKHLKQNPVDDALYKVVREIKRLYGQEHELLINKTLSDSSVRILLQGLANIRKDVLEAIQAIFIKQGKEFDVNDNPVSDNASENALYQIWQILRELYPFELELAQKGNVSEFTAGIFARDLARMRELANEAIRLIRAKEFEQFEKLKDDDND